MIYYAAAAVAYILLCVIVAMIGRRRKWGYWGYLWSSVLFTPVLGLMFVLAADPPPRRRRVSGVPTERT
jgi:Na+/melibiose symporter-like transporter